MAKWEHVAALALLTAGLGACGPKPIVIDDKPGEATVRYSCEGGRGFEAVFVVGASQVTLTSNGQQMVLPQIPATNGIAYSNGTTTFRAQERQAFVQGWPGGDFVNCTGSSS